MPATMELEIVEVERKDRIALMRVEGPLDAGTARTLVRRCARVLDQGRHLVLNLAGVTFIGSSGVGALLMLTEDFEQQALMIRFAPVSETVRGAIELLGLEDCLAVDSDEVVALAALEDPR